MVYSSLRTIEERIIQLHEQNKKPITLVIIGGCARSGKSTLTNSLATSLLNKGINGLTISLDAWLLGVDKRTDKMTVLERYDTERFVLDLDKLLNGEIIFPPIYDPVSRKRVSEEGDPKCIKSGVLIVEGVVALAAEKIRDKSDINLFVMINDCERIKRLVDFYSRIKMIEKKVYKQIIMDREKEEVLLIKNTIKHADLVFSNTI